ncbi:MAG TPA: aquaporin [Candidatus Eisenbacteria bacterium]
MGAAVGVWLMAALLGPPLAQPPVRFVITMRGSVGVGAAFTAEALISAGLMLVVLAISNTPRLSRWTGVAAGALVAAYISLEAPLSGMSMNPARSAASAVAAHHAPALWIYFLAPPLGMWLAAEAYLRWRGTGRVFCAKLHHHPGCCIFCEWRARAAPRQAVP